MKKENRSFEELLRTAVTEHYKIEEKNIPDDAELKKLFPIPKKELEFARKADEQKKHRKPIWLIYAGRCALIALCAVSLSFAMLLTDPGIRGAVGGAITNFMDEYMSIDFGKDPEYEKIDISKTDITYIPEGFEITEHSEGEKKLSYKYANNKGEYILIDITTSSDIKLITDTSVHDIEEAKCNGYKCYISYNDALSQGSVYFGNGYFTVAVSGMISRDELIKTAHGVTVSQ